MSDSRTLIENGPELKAIMEHAIEQARTAPGTRSVYRASVQLEKNVTVRASARQFVFRIDEPPSFGGADAGPNPEEILLAGVGACQTITAALYAALLGISLRAYEVNLKGYVDFGGFYGTGTEGTPVGFNRVVCEVLIDSDAPLEKLREFERLVESRCIGHGTLREPVQIESRWVINGERQEAQ